MEDPKPSIQPSNLDRLKTKVEENKTAVVAATGFVAGVAATLWCVKSPSASYNPAMPIPGLLLTEEDIKRRMAAGILAALFIDSQGWTEKYMKWAYMRADEIADEINATN